jgi:hypothetical protein
VEKCPLNINLMKGSTQKAFILIDFDKKYQNKGHSEF